MMEHILERELRKLKISKNLEIQKSKNPDIQQGNPLAPIGKLQTIGKLPIEGKGFSGWGWWISR